MLIFVPIITTLCFLDVFVSTTQNVSLEDLKNFESLSKNIIDLKTSIMASIDSLNEQVQVQIVNVDMIKKALDLQVDVRNLNQLSNELNKFMPKENEKSHALDKVAMMLRAQVINFEESLAKIFRTILYSNQSDTTSDTELATSGSSLNLTEEEEEGGEEEEGESEEEKDTMTSTFRLKTNEK